MVPRLESEPVTSTSGRFSLSKFPLAAIGLLLLAFIANWHHFSSPLLSSWDVLRGLGNPAGRHWGNLASLFTSAYYETYWESSYHPLPAFIYFLNDKLFGINPIGLKLLKVALMWGGALLLVDAAKRELGSWSWAAGALYVIHPMHFGDLMAIMRHQLVAFFCLLALCLHRRAWKADHPLRYSISTAIAYALSLMSKEYAIILPLLLLSHDWILGEIPKETKRRRAWLAGYILLGAVAAAYAGLLLRLGVNGGGTTIGFLGYSPNETVPRLITRICTLGFQLAGPAADMFGGWVLGPIALYLLAMFFTERRIFLAYGSWLIIGLVVLSGLIPVRPLSIYLADNTARARYVILAGAGYAVLLALSLKRTFGGRRWGAAAAPVALSLSLAAGTLFNLSGKAFMAKLDKCLRSGANMEYGCSNILASVFISLPRLRVDAPNEYSEYRRKLEAGLGADAAIMERYYSGVLEDPCRRASMFYHREQMPLQEELRYMNASGAYHEGCGFLKDKDWPAAAERFKKAISLNPESPRAYQPAAFAAAKLGSAGEARTYLHTHDVLLEMNAHPYETRWCRCLYQQ